VLNAANEVAVANFLDGALRFPDITRLVEESLADADFEAPRSIGDVLEIDAATRVRAEALTKASCS
jgi:1-deoxy-D-xylulose-5-phosphate reductoisomerase